MIENESGSLGWREDTIDFLLFEFRDRENMTAFCFSSSLIGRGCESCARHIYTIVVCQMCMQIPEPSRRAP